MARRRRRRYTWLPNLGAGSGFTGGDLAGRQITLGVPANGSPNIITVPLTFDFPQEGTDPGVTTATPLADFIGNEYIIERIVGNMFYSLSAAATEPLNSGAAVLVTAGLFVARAEDANPEIPVGSAFAADELRNYSPQFTDNIREPWMFRRTWILGHQFAVHTTGQLTVRTDLVGVVPLSATLYAYPMSNVFYGTAVGGPFVDVKSSRRVGQDERLFWVTTAQNFPVDSVQTATVLNLTGFFDYRILGQLIKPHNRSTF